MKVTNWFERQFDLSKNTEPFSSIIVRLESTPVRVRKKLKDISPSTLGIQYNGKWSILEQIGHLGDLEPLWQGRLQDILNGENIMRPADLGNKETTEAGHHLKDPELVVSHFEKRRAATIASLKKLSEEDLLKMSIHPRLKKPMQIRDLFWFVAEHDDHHLAKIDEIVSNSR